MLSATGTISVGPCAREWLWNPPRQLDFSLRPRERGRDQACTSRFLVSEILSWIGLGSNRPTRGRDSWRRHRYRYRIYPTSGVTGSCVCTEHGQPDISTCMPSASLMWGTMAYKVDERWDRRQRSVCESQDRLGRTKCAWTRPFSPLDLSQRPDLLAKCAVPIAAPVRSDPIRPSNPT